MMAKGHAFEEKPEHIGNVQAVIYDYETGKCTEVLIIRAKARY